MAQGGYQAPANPAPVGMPGALSQRTDVQAPMEMTGGAYGDTQAMADIQGGADMYAAPSPMPTPLLAPSQRPDLPVTDGAMLGPGRGVDALGAQDAARKEMSGIAVYQPMMEKMASREDAPRAFRALVQYMKALNG